MTRNLEIKNPPSEISILLENFSKQTQIWLQRRVVRTISDYIYIWCLAEVYLIKFNVSLDLRGSVIFLTYHPLFFLKRKQPLLKGRHEASARPETLLLLV